MIRLAARTLSLPNDPWPRILRVEGAASWQRSHNTAGMPTFRTTREQIVTPNARRDGQDAPEKFPEAGTGTPLGVTIRADKTRLVSSSAHCVCLFSRQLGCLHSEFGMTAGPRYFLDPARQRCRTENISRPLSAAAYPPLFLRQIDTAGLAQHSRLLTTVVLHTILQTPR